MTSGEYGISHSIHERLLNASRKTGEDFNGLLKKYAYQGFLRRLQYSDYSSRFILKGAFLLVLWIGDYNRPTKDMDMLVCGETSEELVMKMMAEICAVSFESDGLIFDTSKMKIEDIREEEEYHGLRVRIIPSLAKYVFHCKSIWGTVM